MLCAPTRGLRACRAILTAGARQTLWSARIRNKAQHITTVLGAGGACKYPTAGGVFQGQPELSTNGWKASAISHSCELDRRRSGASS